MRWIKNMKMWQKFALVISVVIIPLLIMIVLNMTGSISQKMLVTELTERRFFLYEKSTKILEDVLTLDSEFELLITKSVNGVDPESSHKFNNSVKESMDYHIQSTQEILSLDYIDSDEKDKFEFVVEQMKTYRQICLTISYVGQIGGGYALKSMLEQAESSSIRIKNSVLTLKKYESNRITEIKETIIKDNKRRFVVTLIITLLSLLIPTALLTVIVNIIVTPVKKLVRYSNEVAKGNRNVECCLIDTKDEIGDLSRSISTMVVEMDKASAQELIKEQLEGEMKIAQKIQTAIVPINPVDDCFDIAASMTPAEQVGGDYYDYQKDSEGNPWFAIGDVSGHGVTSGLIMMMAQSAFSASLLGHDNRGVDPSVVINQVNSVLTTNIRKRLGEKHFMTMAFLKYLGDGNFQHAGQHIDILIYRNEFRSIETIKTSGIYLGIVPDISKKTANRTFHMQIGDIMLLDTDGIDEARNKEDRSLMGVEKIHEIILRFARYGVEKIKEEIKKAAMEWCGYEPADDITMMVIKRTK